MKEYKYIIVDDLNELKKKIETPEVSFTIKHDLKCNKEGYEFLKEHIDDLKYKRGSNWD